MHGQEQRKSERDWVVSGFIPVLLSKYEQLVANRWGITNI